MIADLQRQVHEAIARGTPILAAEDGIPTWNDLLDILETGCGRKWTIEERARMAAGPGFFLGIPIRPSREVPDGKLWPIASIRD